VAVAFGDVLAAVFGFDDEYALKLASNVLFGAYDAGCDFLVVNDKK